MSKRNLKRFPRPEELSPQTRQLIDVLQHGNDLACALTGASFLDHCLASLLQKFLSDGETSVGLLQPGKPLGDFAARRMLCYSLGLIGKSVSANLEVIGSIRNKFAHQFFDINFANPDIVDLCDKLNPLGIDLTGVGTKAAKSSLQARDAFTISVALLADRLL